MASERILLVDDEENARSAVRSLLGEDGYELDWSTNGSSFSTLATLGADVTGYTVGGLLENHAYYFRVKALSGSAGMPDSIAANRYAMYGTLCRVLHQDTLRTSTSWSTRAGRSAAASRRRWLPVFIATARAPIDSSSWRASASGTMPSGDAESTSAVV